MRAKRPSPSSTITMPTMSMARVPGPGPVNARALEGADTMPAVCPDVELPAPVTPGGFVVVVDAVVGVEAGVDVVLVDATVVEVIVVAVWAGGAVVVGATLLVVVGANVVVVVGAIVVVGVDGGGVEAASRRASMSPCSPSAA